MTPVVAGRCLAGVLLVALIAWIGLRLDDNQLPVLLVLTMIACLVAALAALVRAASKGLDPEGTSTVYPPMPAAEPLGTLPASSALPEGRKSSPTCSVCKTINPDARMFCLKCRAPLTGPSS